MVSQDLAYLTVRMESHFYFWTEISSTPQRQQEKPTTWKEGQTEQDEILSDGYDDFLKLFGKSSEFSTIHKLLKSNQSVNARTVANLYLDLISRSEAIRPRLRLQFFLKRL